MKRVKKCKYEKECLNNIMNQRCIECQVGVVIGNYHHISNLNGVRLYGFLIFCEEKGVVELSLYWLKRALEHSNKKLVVTKGMFGGVRRGYKVVGVDDI